MLACSVANPGTTNGGTASNISLCLFCVRSGPDGIIHGYRSNNISWFAQDDWKVSSRLTLNLGVRWEYDGTLSDKYGNLTNVWESQVQLVNTPAGVAGIGPNGGLPTSGGTFAGYVVPNNFPRLTTAIRPPAFWSATAACRCAAALPMNNFAPRFGFAWQPFGGSKFVVRGGVGLFYDRIGGNQFVHSVEQGNPYADHARLRWQRRVSPPACKTSSRSARSAFIPRWVNFSNGTSSEPEPAVHRRRTFTRRSPASTT